MVAMPETAPAQKLDAETEAALTLFNEYVIADREATRRKREVSKAEKAKDQAAAEVRKLENDGGSAEAKATAEAAYRDAVAALKDVREGKKPEPKAEAEAEPTPEPVAEAESEAPTDADSTGDSVQTEVTAGAEAAPAEAEAAPAEPEATATD